MCRILPSWLLCATLLVAQWSICQEGVSAEFRTSSRGKTLVRTVQYEEPLDPLPTIDMGGFDPLAVQSASPVVGVGDCCGNPQCMGQCGPSYCGPGYCGPGWSYWASFEFLMWWRKGQNLPPLVTTAPTTTPESIAGVLGEPDTAILYARDTQASDARPGGRLSLGLWFDPCQYSGVGARWFMLGESTAHYDQDSSNVPVLARPFFNTDLGDQDAVQLAYPNSLAGSVSIRNRSRVTGGDVFYRHLLFNHACKRIDLIAGYQFARIDTELTIADRREALSTTGTIPNGTVVEVMDMFDTRNSYNAGELGLWGTYDGGPITWSLLAKVGLGNMSQRMSISGQTVATLPDASSSITNQGLLALNSNSGIYKRNVFTVSPELAFQGAYHLNNCIDLTFGYSFVLWNHVAQAGDQIDLRINPTQLTGALTGPAFPDFPERDSTYFVHGLNFGVSCIW